MSRFTAPLPVDFGVFDLDDSALTAGRIGHSAMIAGETPKVLPRLAQRVSWIADCGPGGTDPWRARREGAVALYAGPGIGSAALLALARSAAQLDLPLVVDAWDADLDPGGRVTEGETATRLGLLSTPAVAEAVGVARALTITAAAGCAVHLLTLTTASALAQVRAAKASGRRVTAGTAPPYWLLNDYALERRDRRHWLTPPLRSEGDRLACREALRDGTIDLISSRHSPAQPASDTLLAASLSLIADGTISTERWIALTSGAVVGVTCAPSNGSTTFDTDRPVRIALDHDGPLFGLPFSGGRLA